MESLFSKRETLPHWTVLAYYAPKMQELGLHFDECYVASVAAHVMAARHGRDTAILDNLQVVFYDQVSKPDECRVLQICRRYEDGNLY